MNCGSMSNRSSHQRRLMRKEDAPASRIDERSKLSCMSCEQASGWNALPRELGASSTIHDRFQEWEQAGFFKAFWQAGLSEYDDLVGIKSGMASRRWGDEASAPFGTTATGANPTDRGKRGTKRSLLTDGAGIPLARARGWSQSS